jgi:hypothetical protein
MWDGSNKHLMWESKTTPCRKVGSERAKESLGKAGHEETSVTIVPLEFLRTFGNGSASATITGE